MNPDAAWAPLSDELLAAAVRAAAVDEVRRRIVAQNPGHDHRLPIYYIAIAPEADERYECTIDGATFNGRPVPPFRDALRAPQRLLAAGLYWLTAHDPLAPILPQHFEVTDRFGSLQLAAARMIRREPDLPSFDGVITSGAPYHETIPIGAILHLAGSATVRANGLSFFPIQWSGLAAPRPHQLIGGCTAVVNATRQLRVENPVQSPSVAASNHSARRYQPT